MRAVYPLVVLVVVFSCLGGLSALDSDETTTTTEKATTTEKTTTTASTTTTTKATTTAVPTTTEIPTTPKPVVVKAFPDNIGNWNVTDSASNITCIKVNAAIQLAVNFTVLGENKTEEAKVGKVDVPENASATGKCASDSQTLTLKWENKENKTNQVVLTFTASEDKNTTTGNFSLTSIDVIIYKDNETFPNATSPGDPVTVTLKETPIFTTPLNKSYRCQSDFEVKPSNSTVAVDFQNSQVEAFRKTLSNDTQFSTEFVCTADQVASQSFWMSFFVGIFVVLLIAAAIAGVTMFIIRKRRSRVGSGYENM